MADKIIAYKYNEVFAHITCEDFGVYHEISDHFQFEVANARHMPKVKMGMWDGWIRMFNISKRLLPLGLWDDFVEFCSVRGYELEIHDNPTYGVPGQSHVVSPEELVQFVTGLNLHSRGIKLDVHDYQYVAMFKTLKNMRRTVISPTGSGKSLIIYCVVRYLNALGYKVLLLCSTIGLVNQMFKDFKDYSSDNGWDVQDNCHLIYDGAEKKTDKPVVISTWQSLQKSPSQYFQQFDGVLVDEVHGAKSTSIQTILEKCTEAFYRVGFTGSLDNSLANKMLIQAMLGPIVRVAKTRELIDRGVLSEAKINVVVLNYSDETKRAMKKVDYQKEIDFICAHERRNKFIRNLALSLDGNVLVLYAYVDKHGKILHDMISERAGDRKTFFIHGEVGVEDRDEVGRVMSSNNNAIAVCSVGTFAVGVNIPKLKYVIFASPTKSVIRVLQSIGRGLRKADGKDFFGLYDIGDRLSTSKKNPNHTMRHLTERLGIYAKEEHQYKIVEVNIEE